MVRSGTHWIEVSRGALRHNVGVLRSVVRQGTELAAVVKANAYGHGLPVVVEAIGDAVDWMAVHTAGEARSVREAGFSGPVLVMGFVPEWDLHDLDGEVHVLVSTAEVLRWIGAYRDRTGITLPVHLKIETGTHRQGISPAEIPDFVREAAEYRLEIAGIATHFANIEDTLNHEFAQQQIGRFRDAVALLRRELGGDPPFVHAACSAAALLFRDADFTLVRAGISLYGHWPSRETRLSWILERGREENVTLRPALTWKVMVGQVQEVERGGTVGYGRTWTALRPTRLAVLPVGYADGYPRSLGNRSRVVVRGTAVPVVGRVCMNITMADITDVKGVGVGDEVVLIGGQGDVSVTAEELAELAGTINYELLARLSPEIPRRLVR